MGMFKAKKKPKETAEVSDEDVDAMLQKSADKPKRKKPGRLKKNAALLFGGAGAGAAGTAMLSEPDDKYKDPLK